jgi:flagellar biosynthesis/type III secretory pathway M-ring protein FliF/YscJ
VATAPPAEVVLPSAGPGAEAGAPAATPEPEDLQLRGLQERVRTLIEQDPRKVASMVKRWLMREG